MVISDTVGKTRMAPKQGGSADTATANTERGARSDGWQGELLARVRRIMQEADPDVVEERKWRKPTNPAGVPVWSHDGIICTGETYKDHVRLTFAKGAFLKAPKGLFNAGLEGNAFRAIVLREGDRIDDAGLKDLIRAAVAFNKSKAGAK